MKIPQRVLEQHTAILGKTGSGKTFTAKGIAEHLLENRQRVCAIDPTGVWFGLRSDSTGKKPAFPVVVFGGEHGDVPLGSNHGTAIAEIIGTTDTSAVIDTQLMTVGERTRFFTDFAETLLRKNKGPLHLIIDEAHVFAPQGRVADPQSGRMLHATNNLVSLGRGRGLRIIMISQRPAKLHKDSLTQAETLIAMRLIAPQDRSAVEDWIGEWADPKKGKEILASLPSLPTGEGWLWSPEIGILERMKFPRIKTYDSSRAPDSGSSPIVLANIDLPTIQSRLEQVATDVFQNDPARLRKRIAELEEEGLRRTPEVPVQTLTETIEVEKLVITEEQLSRLERGVTSLETMFINTNAEVLKPILEALRLVQRQGEESVRPVHNMSVAPAAAPPKSTVANNGTSTISGMARKLLTVLAKYPVGMGVDRLAILAGSTVSGHFNNTLGTLRSAGYVTPARVLPIQATAEGIAALGSYDPLPTGRALRQYWLNRLGGGLQAKILGALIQAYPRTMAPEELATACDSTVSGHFNNSVGSLRTMGLMTPARTPIKASDDLFR